MRLVAIFITVLSLVATAEAADVKTITRSQRVDVKQHLVAGKYVVVDFYADWCGACRQIDPVLKKLANQHEPRLALRKVDVVQWGSPVASQYNISSLPYLELYDPAGKRIAAGGASQVLGRLEKELASQAAPGPAVASATKVEVARGDSGSRLPVLVVVVATLLGALFIAARTGVLPNPLHTIGRRALDSSLWFVERHGAFDGPYSLGQLRALRRQGRVDDATPVCRKADAERMTVTEALGARG